MECTDAFKTVLQMTNLATIFIWMYVLMLLKLFCKCITNINA